MFKLIVLGIIGFVVYKLFFSNQNESSSLNSMKDKDEDELIQCSKCGTFVPKSECSFIGDKCLCKECR
jgi:formylmethanofuran dehydrogenase subunit E